VSLRSPLRRVTGLGSARGGSGHWFAQRVSAVALVLLGLWFTFALVTLGGATHANVVGWLASPWSSALAILLVIVAAWHALLGLQVVIEDYVPDHGQRMAVLLVVKFTFVVATVVGVLAVLRIALGDAA
jgi:succinate dehydrogenase / fumarate reductase membrane anchor subunit